MNIRSNFPFLVTNDQIVYFDTAATGLKLQSVIDAELSFLALNGSNPHAKDYQLGFDAYEKINVVRTKICNLINANKKEEIIFTSGTTHSINLLANGLKKFIKSEDEILLTSLEHSANMLPWINLGNETNALVKAIPLNEDFSIDLAWLKKNISKKTKLITISHVTNTIGNTNDIKSICRIAKIKNPNIIIHVDCAQSIAHTKIDVKDWNVDFISWSAHKMYGPFGLGCLWGEWSKLDKLTPIFFGGGMNKKIHENLKDFQLANLPEKLEGGTPNISAIYAYEPAIDFINKILIENINLHENSLKAYFREMVLKTNLTNKIEFYNLASSAPIILFNVKGINPQDVAVFLDKKYHIAVRGGASCARRIDSIINTDIAVRISFGIYNTKEEIDRLIAALNDVENFLEEIF